ncbi:MAG: hypothetical protein N4A46_12180 [Schleiferiaceae bacterium]|jgi:ABC-type spermidine/putrescine transport system permease subunit II|nr:hypothetical protein [Schleiferiaceae bacterium]
MKTSKTTLKIILWAARVSGTLILAFILFMALAHVFGDEESGNGFQNTREIIAFIFFPVSTVIGLSLALKWEGLGGIVTVFAMLGLIIVRPDLLGAAAILVLFPTVPGILYILYWALTKETPNHATAV